MKVHVDETAMILTIQVPIELGDTESGRTTRLCQGGRILTEATFMGHPISVNLIATIPVKSTARGPKSAKGAANGDTADSLRRKLGQTTGGAAPFIPAEPEAAEPEAPADPLAGLTPAQLAAVRAMLAPAAPPVKAVRLTARK